jgi:hypothetical protein
MAFGYISKLTWLAMNRPAIAVKSRPSAGTGELAGVRGGQSAEAHRGGGYLATERARNGAKLQPTKIR